MIDAAEFEALLGEWRFRPYDLCTCNCVLWARAAVLAQAGPDIADLLGLPIGCWERPDAARRIVARFDGVRALIVTALPAEIPLLQVRRGDLVFCSRHVEPGWSEAVGVWDGQHGLFVGANGLQPRLLSQCDGAVRVGPEA
jgi:hypothetical protein